MTGSFLYNRFFHFVVTILLLLVSWQGKLCDIFTLSGFKVLSEEYNLEVFGSMKKEVT
jgi:hypothetical protein